MSMKQQKAALSFAVCDANTLLKVKSKKVVTQEMHYENYRADRLVKGIKNKENDIKPERDSLVPIKIVVNSVLTEKDRILQEKEAELRRMQEMLAQMQTKIQAQQ